MTPGGPGRVRAIALDCDGVILDTNRMKMAAFETALAGYPAAVVARFLAYQRSAFGRSRYRLFGDFFADFLERAPRAGETEGLLAAFGDLCRAGYLDAPMTQGAAAFIERARRAASLFVVSGSDQAELRGVFEARGLAAPFTDVLGSPTGKAEHLRAIEAGPPGARIAVFIGDAVADFEASRAVGVPFHFVSGYGTDNDRMDALRSRHGFTASPTLAGAEGWTRTDPPRGGTP